MFYNLKNIITLSACAGASFSFTGCYDKEIVSKGKQEVNKAKEGELAECKMMEGKFLEAYFTESADALNNNVKQILESIHKTKENVNLRLKNKKVYDLFKSSIDDIYRYEFFLDRFSSNVSPLLEMKKVEKNAGRYAETMVRILFSSDEFTKQNTESWSNEKNQFANFDKLNSIVDDCKKAITKFLKAEYSAVNSIIVNSKTLLDSLGETLLEVRFKKNYTDQLAFWRKSLYKTKFIIISVLKEYDVMAIGLNTCFSKNRDYLEKLKNSGQKNTDLLEFMFSKTFFGEEIRLERNCLLGYGETIFAMDSRILKINGMCDRRRAAIEAKYEAASTVIDPSEFGDTVQDMDGLVSGVPISGQQNETTSEPIKKEEVLRSEKLRVRRANSVSHETSKVRKFNRSRDKEVSFLTNQGEEQKRQRKLSQTKSVRSYTSESDISERDIKDSLIGKLKSGIRKSLDLDRIVNQLNVDVANVRFKTNDLKSEEDTLKFFIKSYEKKDNGYKCCIKNNFNDKLLNFTGHWVHGGNAPVTVESTIADYAIDIIQRIANTFCNEELLKEEEDKLSQLKDFFDKIKVKKELIDEKIFWQVYNKCKEMNGFKQLLESYGFQEECDIEIKISGLCKNNAKKSRKYFSDKNTTKE